MDLFDNYLSENYFNFILKEVGSPFFPWYRSTVLVPEDFLGNPRDNIQFCHPIFHNPPQGPCLKTKTCELFEDLFKQMGVKELLSVKLNLNPRHTEIIEHGYHIDLDWDRKDDSNAKTSIFYLNTNNGYTKFKTSGKKIQSVSNRLVTFNTNMMHTGTTSNNVDARLVLNINYFI